MRIRRPGSNCICRPIRGGGFSNEERLLCLRARGGVRGDQQGTGARSFCSDRTLFSEMGEEKPEGVNFLRKKVPILRWGKKLLP